MGADIHTGRQDDAGGHIFSDPFINISPVQQRQYNGIFMYFWKDRLDGSIQVIAFDADQNQVRIRQVLHLVRAAAGTPVMVFWSEISMIPFCLIA